MRFVFFSLIIILFGCHKACFAEYQEREDSKLVDEISAKVIKKLIFEKALFPSGSGGSMMHQIKWLHWAFHYYQELNIPKARRLLIEATKEFLNAFNDDERICPYLANYPFTPKNLEISIVLSKHNGESIKSNELVIVSMKEGKLKYNVEHEETGLHRLVFSETYEEALEKIKQYNH